MFNIKKRQTTLFFYKYLHNVGGKVQLDAIPMPDSDFTSAMDILERTLAHEKRLQL